MSIVYTGDQWRQHSCDDYVFAFNRLLPQGQAWNRDPTSVQQQFFHGLNCYWGDVDAAAALLLTTESDPRATLMLLPDWERAWGLPDPCAPVPTSIADRRTALVTKMTLLGGQSRAYFVNLAAALGYTITITEYSPFMTGVSQCGDTSSIYNPGDPQHYRWTIGPAEMRFYWTVHVSDVRYTWFRCSVSQCGVDPLLGIGLAIDLECLIRRYKPAQTDVIFDYSPLTSTGLNYFEPYNSTYLALGTS